MLYTVALLPARERLGVRGVGVAQHPPFASRARKLRDLGRVDGGSDSRQSAAFVFKRSQARGELIYLPVGKGDAVVKCWPLLPGCAWKHPRAVFTT